MFCFEFRFQWNIMAPMTIEQLLSCTKTIWSALTRPGFMKKNREVKSEGVT